MNTNLFSNVVGQLEAKKKVGFYLNSYHHTHIMAHLMWCAPKGNGKSLLARETAKELVAYGEDGKPLMKEDGKTPKKKTFFEIHASTIKGLRAFVNGFLATKVVNRDVTVFIDEAHNLKHDVTQAFLTILNPNPDNRTQFAMDDMIYDFDFRRQTFMFATTETNLIFPPLMDRLTRIELQHYTHEDLAKIVQRSAPEVKFTDDVLEIISSVVRGNARQAVKMASDIKTYLCDKHVFGRKQWKDLSGILSIKPLGLTPAEIQLLRCMEERPNGSSLTNLSARTGLSRDAIMRDYELYLQAQGLMAIEAGKGRVLTGKGQQYLKELAAYEAKLA